ncbi:MAG TPA: DUF4038 domain-containing protein [Vicinamibacteria bacterium]|nr:DUF4038 domain-containing protein [Vicinamibacteria bacterium]
MPRARVTFALVLVSLTVSAAEPSVSVPRWGRFEASFTAADEYENPVQDVRVEASFVSPSGRARRADAFWHGGRTWTVRFSPDEAGRWSFRTRASREGDRGLHAREGSFTCVPYEGRNPLHRHGPLRVAPSRRHFVHADGTPFFWLADTAWNGPMKADEGGWADYLRARAAGGFTAVQFVTTQWRAAAGNADARPAFYGRERIAIEPEFFAWMDERVDALNDRGLVAAPVLVWDVGGRTAPMNPGQLLPDDQIVVLARHMVARWGSHHVVFFLAGDGDYRDERAERWRRIGRAVFGEEAPPWLVTMHPGGRMWVYDEFRGEPWFAFNGYQSGHGDGPDSLRWLTEGPPAREWRKVPAHPHVNLEPNYEAHVARPSGTVFDDRDVRRAAYWSLLVAPPAGVSYGAHGVWSWETKPRPPMTHPYTGTARPWREAVGLPGAASMKVLRDLLAGLAWWELRPDPELLAEQPGAAAPERFAAAARSGSGDAALVYLPEGGRVALRMERFPRAMSAEWVDPATGRKRPAGEVPNRGTRAFEASPDHDWVLVLR